MLPNRSRPRAVEAERVHDEARVPAALAAGQDGGGQFRRERPGREVEIGHADLLPLALRPGRALGVGVGRDNHPIGGDRPFACREPPELACPLGRAHRASRVDRRAGGDCSAGQSARVSQRLDGAGAQIEQRPGIDVDADAPRRLLAAENLHRRAARAPLPRALLDLGEARTPDRAMQRAVAHQFAVDPVLLDQGVNLGRAPPSRLSSRSP